jgi:hypothetical protein
MCGPSPSLSLPRRTLLPRHNHTDAHDCVHTSPCIPWRPQTWHADTRAHTATPTPAARPRHLPRPSPPRRRRAVAASAPRQHARSRRLSASWCARPGEQACGQRRGHSDKSGLGRRRRSPAQGTLHSGHAPAQAHCNRGSHGRPPVLCTLHANACAHVPDGKAFTYPSMHSGALLPRHSWHAGTRAHTATPTPAARPRHLHCPWPLRRRRAVAASAPPQHARNRRQGASWCSRPGEQACCQRRGHSY